LLRAADNIDPPPSLECIGVGSPVASDAKARAKDVTEVPVIVGSTHGKQGVRATPDELQRPEAFILRLLEK